MSSFCIFCLTKVLYFCCTHHVMFAAGCFLVHCWWHYLVSAPFLLFKIVSPSVSPFQNRFSPFPKIVSLLHTQVCIPSITTFVHSAISLHTCFVSPPPSFSQFAASVFAATWNACPPFFSISLLAARSFFFCNSLPGPIFLGPICRAPMKGALSWSVLTMR